MDIQTPLIFVGLFSLASILLVFIYKFGIKQKSYEEALAEQRLQTQILLGKPKNKEKKVKKPSKKIKQKNATTENEIVEDNSETVIRDKQQNIDSQPKKPHVEFKDVTEEVTIKTVAQTKKQSKKEKVKPILVQKGKNEELANSISDTEANLTNHFEELHPKDDLELLRSIHTTNSEEQPAAEKLVKSHKSESKKPSETVAPVPVVQKVTPPTSTAPNGLIGNTGKEKKKKKSEFNTLQQLAGDSNGPNMSVLLNLVRKAELSRSEVQILIDLLLNKQHEAPAILDEWSEGKSDPVQKLKKQLAEKERLWLEEKQLSVSAQNKLRELRAEFQSDKSHLLQKLRGCEEALQTKQSELAQAQQVSQQAQNQLKEERLKAHKLNEELSAMQRQQLEIHLNQTQESDMHIAQLRQELAAVNTQMNMEMKRKNDEILLEKERSQACIHQLQKELEQFAERTRQFEETILERERTIESLLKQNNDYKAENIGLNSALQQVNEEIRRLEHSKKQSVDEIQDLTKLVNQLNSDIKKIQEEKALQNAHMNGSLQESKQHQIEILNLHNQISSLKSELNQTQLDSETKLKNTTALVENLKLELQQEQIKLEEQKQKNNELRTKNWKAMEALNAAESKLKNNTNEKPTNDIEKAFLQRLFPEIKELDKIKSENFLVESEQYIKKFINHLREQKIVVEEKVVEKIVVKENDNVEVHQLKSQLQHYKNVIDNAEKMLNNLQKHIEQEEINWRMQLAEKNAEIEAIKDSKLHEKLTSLERELEDEKEEKKRIISELQKVQNASKLTKV